MVENLETLKQENQELLNEIETLKKQLTEKEEEFKLRTWNAVDNAVKEYRVETLRTLQRLKWPENGWLSYPEKSLTEFGKVVFSDEFTPENVVKSFANEVWYYEDLFQFFYKKNEEAEKKIVELEKKLEEENIRKMEEELKEKTAALESWKERFENRSVDEVHSMLRNFGLANILLTELREKESQLKEMIISISCENRLEAKEISLLEELFQEQEKISKSGEISVYERSKEITRTLTEEKLTNEQVQNLLDKQRKITNLEKEINFLQNQSFQTKIEVPPQSK